MYVRSANVITIGLWNILSVERHAPRRDKRLLDFPFCERQTERAFRFMCHLTRWCLTRQTAGCAALSILNCTRCTSGPLHYVLLGLSALLGKSLGGRRPRGKPLNLLVYALLGLSGALSDIYWVISSLVDLHSAPDWPVVFLFKSTK